MATRKRQFSVKIGPLIILVLFDSQALAMRDRDKTESTYGEFVANDGMIYVREDMSASFERYIVMHEVSHVIHEVCNLHDVDFTDNQTEENVVAITSPIWYQVIRDNPEFIEYLCEEV